MPLAAAARRRLGPHICALLGSLARAPLSSAASAWPRAAAAIGGPASSSRAADGPSRGAGGAPTVPASPTALGVPAGKGEAHQRGAAPRPLSPAVPPAREAFDPAEHATVMKHFAALLTKRGKRGSTALMEANMRLRTLYGVPDPLQRAVRAITPSVRFAKSKTSRAFLPVALFPESARSIAIRWIIEAASGRLYNGGRPDLVRGLVDEAAAIIDGTSALYARRFNLHRNPN